MRDRIYRAPPRVYRVTMSAPLAPRVIEALPYGSGHRDGSGEEGEPIGGLDIYDEADFGLEPTVKRGFDPDGRPTMEFEMTSARQARFLQLAKGREAVVHLTSLGTTEGDWQRLRVRKVRWIRRRK